jgi:NADPH-dependent 2,4-dienoyl-CoA reductase/sulfur reductase-like enzyme/rhodanese-related sulfurtransferase
MVMKTRLVIVGGVAAGATAAARARRISEEAEITVIERGPYVSYANCGLPYYIARDIEKRSALLLQTPEGFDARYGVRVLVQSEVTDIDRAGRRVLVRTPQGETCIPYDKLILAQGGNPIMPPTPGADSPNVFRLWTVPDTDRLHTAIDELKAKTAVVVGGGFIGLEMAEAFRKRGLATTVVELLPSVMAVMDRDLGQLVSLELERNGVRVITNTAVKAVLPAERLVELSDGRRLPADIVLFSVGVRPEIALAQRIGLAVGPSGGLAVDDHLRTTDPHIYAAGDMIEVTHKVGGRRARVPLAGPANRQGRIAASNALGMDLRYTGVLGTSVVKIFDATASQTGLSEKAARDAGFSVGTAIVHRDHHAAYYPGATELTLKLLYDRKTARVLGAQAFGRAGVEKRIDVVATALQGKLTLNDLAELDLAYAPPYSSANDPVNMAAFVGLNDLSGFSPLITPVELKTALISADKPVLLDVRTLSEFSRSHLAGAINIPVDELRFELDSVPRDRRIAVYCRVGFRGHLALRILKANGFSDVVNVTGGYLSLLAEGGFDVEET